MFFSPSLSFFSVFQFPSVFTVSLHSVFQLLFVPFIRFLSSFLFAFLCLHFSFPISFPTNYKLPANFLLPTIPFPFFTVFFFLDFYPLPISILASFLLSFSLYPTFLPTLFLVFFILFLPSSNLFSVFCFSVCLYSSLYSFPPSFLISLPKLPYYFLFVFFSL